MFRYCQRHHYAHPCPQCLPEVLPDGHAAQSDCGDEHHPPVNPWNRGQRPPIHARSLSELRRKETARAAEDGFGGPRPRAVVTNTPRPGETKHQIAQRYRITAADLEPAQRYRITAADLEAPGMKPLLELSERALGAPKYPEGFKPSNPKDAFGILKAGVFSYVPMPVIFELAIAMAEGAFKYGAHNYVPAGVRASVYTDAAARHLAQFTYGEDNDPDSGAALSHITKAIASLTVLRASMLYGTWIDDRPPALPNGWLDRINGLMDDLAAKFPEPVARYLAKGKRGPGRVL